MTAASSTSSSSSYQEPSDLLKRLFLPPKNPSLTLSADLQWLLFCGEPPLPPIEVLARPEERLAGIRFDPVLLAPSRLEFALDLTAQHLATGQRIPIPLPPKSQGIRYLRFNPNPPRGILQQFVFTSKTRDKSELIPYLCNLTRIRSTDEPPLFAWHVQEIPSLDKCRLNYCAGCAYQFTSDGQYLLVRVVPPQLASSPPPVEPISVGPSIQTVDKDARKAPGRTYQDLLQNVHDEAKFRYYLTVQVIQVNVSTLEAEHPLQSERYFAALKAFGIESRLCKLPHERHSYVARESILHMAWEQEEWLKTLETTREI